MAGNPIRGSEAFLVATLLEKPAMSTLLRTLATRAGLLMIAALPGLAACTPASAGPLVDVAVIDRDDGQWLPQYPHRGDQWVAGAPGHRYSVRLTNTTGERVLVVLSVDGINAVTGETAHPAQAGYVLDAWETAEIAGWRKSLDDVAQFVFTDVGDSYAARTGRPRNVGVIGVAAFRESLPRHRPPPVPYPSVARGNARVRDERARDESEASATAAAPAEAGGAANQRAYDSAHGNPGARRQGIGTGHGAREWAPVGSTTFVRANATPDQVSQVRYDDARRLIALGILPRPYLHRERRPQAFPQGFVADPPGWR